MTDAQLVARAQDGDLPAFEELVKKYQREIYGLACRMVSDPEEAKDLSQQAFMQAFIYIRTFARMPNSVPGCSGSPSTSVTTF